MAEHLVGAGARVDPAGLEHHADARAQLTRLAHRVETQDGDRARVGLAVALAGLDGGGLAGSVGAEDGGDGARADVEVEPVHRGLRSVPLDQAPYPDGGLVSHGYAV